MKLNLILFAVTFTGLLANAADYELARVEKNLGPVQSIRLIQVEGSDKLVVRTVNNNKTTSDIDVSKFRNTLRLIVNKLNEASDKIVQKTSETICFNMPGPRPELVITRVDRSTSNNVYREETVLTNVGCEFSSWSAPKSESGETSARILYRFFFDISGLSPI